MPFPYKEINLNQKTTTIIVHRRYHLRVQKECTSSIESIVSTSNEQHPTSDYLAHSLCLSLQSGHRQLKIETSPATGEYNKHYTLHHRRETAGREQAVTERPDAGAPGSCVFKDHCSFRHLPCLPPVAEVKIQASPARQCEGEGTTSYGSLCFNIYILHG